MAQTLKVAYNFHRLTFSLLSYQITPLPLSPDVILPSNTHYIRCHCCHAHWKHRLRCRHRSEYSGPLCALLYNSTHLSPLSFLPPYHGTSQLCPQGNVSMSHERRSHGALIWTRYSYMAEWWLYTATYTVEAQLRPYDNERGVPSSLSKVYSHSWGPWNLIIPRPGITRAMQLLYKFNFIWVFPWRPYTATYKNIIIIIRWPYYNVLILFVRWSRSINYFTLHLNCGNLLK